jgi:hypothetical protein
MTGGLEVPRLAGAIAILCALTAAPASAQISFEPEAPAKQEEPTAPKQDEPPPPPPPPAPKKEDTWTPPVLDFRLMSRLSIDTAFEGGNESVLNFYRFATGSISTRRGKLRLLFTVRLRWVTVEEAPKKPPFWIFNGTRPRSEFEPSLGETSVSGTNFGLDWSAGLLDVSWGQNPAFSPADVLTPIDTRDGPMPTTDGRLPVPAVRIRGNVGPISWDAIYLPVFFPSRLPVIGNDWSPYPLASSPAIPDLQGRVDPTTFASVNSTLGATHFPQLDLTEPQGGLRVSAHPGPLVVALSWSEFFDRSPVLSVSPGLRLALKGLLDTDSNEQLGDFLNASTLLGQEKAQNIAPLTGTFLRTRVFAFDGALTTGPLRWTLDVGYSPQRVFPLPDLTSTVRPMLSGLAGVEWEGPPVIAAGVYSVLALNIPAGVRILYLDPANVNTDRERIASLSIAYVLLRWLLLEDRLELGLSGLVSFRADWFALPSVHWHVGDAHSVGVGANLLGGPAGGFGASYQRNNEAYVEYVLKL